jgi:inner membrane protein
MAAVLLATDQALLLIGAQSIYAGPFDETAHLLTGALVLAALRGCPDRSFAVGVLAMSVLVDLDHVPALAGSNVITGGTDRPYSHSLLALAVLGLAALAWRARRPLLVGVAIGLAAHLARDLTESGSGVPLAWPLGRDSSTLPHWTYLVAIGAVVAIALWRARSAAA